MKSKFQINLNQSKQMPNQIKKSQQGSALIIAIFILVVMGLLGVSLTRMLSSSNDALGWEVLGNRALMAANSAGEMALFELFPPGQALSYCAAVSKKITLFPVDTGLTNCTADITCDEFYQANLGTQHYRITATGHCKAGQFADNINAVRAIEFEARTILP